MPTTNLPDITSSTQIVTTTTSSPRIPSWLHQAVLLANAWFSLGLADQIASTLRVPRGRAGSFCDLDFVLCLVLWSSCGGLSLRTFFADIKPYAAALAGLWGRDLLPAASTLSRYLASVRDEDLASVRAILQANLHRARLSHAACGLFDRCDARYIVFDFDGTVEPARLRAVPQDSERPPANRRVTRACAPGFSGRKRADTQFHRNVLQNAHTGQWLGCWSGAGNGALWSDLELAAKAAVEYVQALNVEPNTAVMRLDGQHGYARGAWICTAAGARFVTRVADRQLWNKDSIFKKIQEVQAETLIQADNGLIRTVYDAGWWPWKAKGTPQHQANVRIILTSTPHKGDKKKPSVGRIRQGLVWEMFATTCKEDGWSAVDVLTVYFGRGGFESTLHQEDLELVTKKWCHYQAPGQILGVLIKNITWNLQIAGGWQIEGARIRECLWSPAQNHCTGEPTQTHQLSAPTPIPEPIPEPSPEPSPEGAAQKNGTDTFGPWRAANARGRAAGKIAAHAFEYDPLKDTVVCPRGIHLKRKGIKKSPHGTERHLWMAPKKECRVCPFAGQCLGKKRTENSAGRSVSFVRKRTSGQTPRAETAKKITPQPKETPVTATAPIEHPRLQQGIHAMRWRDVGAKKCRAVLIERTARQEIKIEQLPTASKQEDRQHVMDRDMRARRRQTWSVRLAKNALNPAKSRWRIVLFGIPDFIPLLYLSSNR